MEHAGITMGYRDLYRGSILAGLLAPLEEKNPGPRLADWRTRPGTIVYASAVCSPRALTAARVVPDPVRPHAGSCNTVQAHGNGRR
jgi:hypothetical protein